jgi:hypothetical protein
MRTGKDSQDTHEPMKLNRAKNKYEHVPKRHVGRNTIKHKNS